MAANARVAIELSLNEPQVNQQFDRITKKALDLARVFTSPEFKKASDLFAEQLERPFRNNRGPAAEYFDGIARQAKTLAQVQQQYSNETSQKISADILKIKQERLKAEEERLKAINEGRKADAQASADRIKDLGHEQKALQLHLQEVRQFENTRRSLARESLSEQRKNERELREEHKRTQEHKLTLIAQNAGKFRTYDEIEVQSAKRKTKELVAEVEELQVAKKRAHDQARLGATEEARAEAKAIETAAKEEIASLNLVLNKRKEVIHEGMGASIGKLGLFREFEAKGVGGALMGGLAGAGAMLTISSIAGAATKMRETARIVDDSGDTLNIAMTRAGKGAAYARAEQMRLIESSKMMADEFAMDRFEINKLQAEIVGFSGITGPLLDKLTRISIGAAQQLQMAPDQIARLLARALNGDSEARLGRIAIHFEKNATAAEKLAIIERKLGASVDATAKSTRDAYGDFDRLQNKVKEAAAEFAAKEFEKLGPVFRDLIPKVDSFFEVLGNVTTFVSRNIDVYAGFGVALGGVAIGIKAITAAMAGNPILLAIGLAAGVATAIAGLRKNIYEASDQAERLEGDLRKINERFAEADKLKAQSTGIEDLTTRYEQLAGKVKLTKKEQTEQNNIAIQLIEATGGAAGKINEFGQAEGFNLDKVKQFTDALHRQNVELRDKALLEAANTGRQAVSQWRANQSEIDKLTAERNRKLAEADRYLRNQLRGVNPQDAAEFKRKYVAGVASDVNTALEAAAQGSTKQSQVVAGAVRSYVANISEDLRKNPEQLAKNIAGSFNIAESVARKYVYDSISSITADAEHKAQGDNAPPETGGGGKDPYEAAVERIRIAKDRILELYINEGHSLEEIEGRRRDLELETDTEIYQAALKFGKNVGELHLKVLNDRISIEQAANEAATKSAQKSYTEQTNRLQNSLNERLYSLDKSLAAGTISQRRYDEDRHKLEVSAYSAELFYAEIFFGKQSDQYKSQYDKLEELEKKYGLTLIARRREDDKARLEFDRASADQRISLIKNQYEREYAAAAEKYRRDIEDIRKRLKEESITESDADELRARAKKEYLDKTRSIEEDSWKGTQDLITGIVQDGADGLLGAMTTGFFDPTIEKLRGMPGFWQKAMAGVLSEVNKGMVSLGTKAAGFAALKLFFPNSKAAQGSLWENLGLSPKEAPGVPNTESTVALPSAMDGLRTALIDLRTTIESLSSSRDVTGPTPLSAFPNTGLSTLQQTVTSAITGGNVGEGTDITSFLDSIGVLKFNDSPGRLGDSGSPIVGGYVLVRANPNDVLVDASKVEAPAGFGAQPIRMLGDSDNIADAITPGSTPKKRDRAGDIVAGLKDRQRAMNDALRGMNAMSDEARKMSEQTTAIGHVLIVPMKELRARIDGMLKQGMSPDEIKDALVESGGEVRDQVAKNVGRNLLTSLITLPAIGMAAGGAAMLAGGGAAASGIGLTGETSAFGMPMISGGVQGGLSQMAFPFLNLGASKILEKTIGEKYYNPEAAEQLSIGVEGLSIGQSAVKESAHAVHTTVREGVKEGFEAAVDVVKSTLSEVVQAHGAPVVGQLASGSGEEPSGVREPIGARRDRAYQEAGFGSYPGAPLALPDEESTKPKGLTADQKQTLEATQKVAGLTKSIAGLAGVSDKASEGTKKLMKGVGTALGIGAQVASLIPGGELVGGLLGIVGGLFDDGGYTGRRQGIGRVRGLGKSNVAGIVHDDEYVAKSEAVHKYGIGFFESVNNGTYNPGTRTIYSAPQTSVNFDTSRLEAHMQTMISTIQNQRLHVSSEGLAIATTVGRRMLQDAML